ncbi:anthranilate synthase component I family protein [Fulvivirga ligni]|uniref:anthranilate synthase component I family protein n=1 Tax=Fulvivirga ligni TaxID=2904246 RepID=UPI001F3E9E82|nr:anthranilate synthase component I family protein [Fulvivirga ligni]UII24070.1 anthranilate synthase component I family protein [Fulvivirga ligni]
MRQQHTYTPNNIDAFIEKALAYGATHDHCAFYDHCHIKFPHQGFKNILAFGTKKVFTSGNDAFEDLKNFHGKHKDWLFGHLAYDLKNHTEQLSSSNVDRLEFPDIEFFIPETIITWSDKSVELSSYNDPIELIHFIETTHISKTANNHIAEITAGTSRDEYIYKVEKLKDHIVEGDIYEINYCIDFRAQHQGFKPLAAYHELKRLSPTPFSAFYRFNDNHLICASPERFLKKEGNLLVSQPIKGTAKRGHSFEEDEDIKHQLRNDKKELAENMMIVDLVRNDLARSSISGTVKPEELFGIYTFNQLHQMISTVTSSIKPEVHFVDAIKNAFPMGSMTGAPKVKVMQLIEQYENNKRGLYSGAVGYITPNGDFDFNVVIRSLLYNANSQTLTFEVGSAITYDAIAEKEYDECLLKAKALLEILGQPTIKGK